MTGDDRRATSTAMIGAVPLRKEIINTRKTLRNACSSSAILVMFAAMGPMNP